MALALRDNAAIGPEVVQNLDNPTSIPSVRFDSTHHPTASISTTNSLSSTVPTDRIVPTGTRSMPKFISYTSRTGSPRVTRLLTATGRPHMSGTVTRHSTVMIGGTSTRTQTSEVNGTTSAGSGAARGQVQHVGVLNVMVAALMVVGVFGGIVVL